MLPPNLISKSYHNNIDCQEGGKRKVHKKTDRSLYRSVKKRVRGSLTNTYLCQCKLNLIKPIAYRIFSACFLKTHSQIKPLGIYVIF